MTGERFPNDTKCPGAGKEIIKGVSEQAGDKSLLEVTQAPHGSPTESDRRYAAIGGGGGAPLFIGCPVH